MKKSLTLLVTLLLFSRTFAQVSTWDGTRNNQIGTDLTRNVCNIVFELYDSYGDGWNGAQLVVAFNDGTPTQYLTISSGDSANYTFTINTGTQVSLNWISGSWDQECSFFVRYENGAFITEVSNINTGYSFNFSVDCNDILYPIDNLNASIGSNNSVILTWEQHLGEPISYIIIRNNVEIDEVTSPSYTDSNLPYGYYQYQVIAKYENGNSEPTLIGVYLSNNQTISFWDGTLEPWAHGTGTEVDPFLIENAQQLAYLAYYVNNGFGASGGHVSGANTYFKLMIDIDLNGSNGLQWIPIGYWNSNTDYYSFGGCFDGNYHEISNLYINSSDNRVGLFGYIYGSTILNIGVEGDITTTGLYSGGLAGYASDNNIIKHSYYDGFVSSSSRSGGIVGYSHTQINISDCNNKGTVSSSNTQGTNTGGIIGQSNGIASISCCYNTGNISSNNGTGAYQDGYTGGIIGLGSTSSNIIDCFNTGSVSSINNGYIGGIVARIGGSITNCYNIGTLSGNVIGGIVSYIINPISVTNCYYLNTCGGSNAYGEQKTEAFMKSQEFVVILNDGSLTYRMDMPPYINQGYPVFSNFTLETMPATSVTYISATMNGDYTSGMFNITSQGFEYKKTTDQNYTTVNCTAGQTPYSYNLNNLTHSTAYHYRAFATAAEGTAYGELVTFTTPTPPTYTITASASSGGTINPSGTITVYEGENKTFTITPNTNYAIQSVLVDGVPVGATSTYTFQNITSNHTIEATFRSLKHHITATATGTSGTISPAGVIEVMEGQNQTFAITPTGESQIQSVLVDGNDVGTVTNYTFQNVTADHTIEAVFYIPGRHQITASVNGPGTITPNGEISVIECESQTFEILPIPQSILDSVTVDNVNIGAITTYTFNNVIENHTICAYFTLISTPDLEPWDGMTKNEPFCFDNTYYICSPTELAWVAWQINNNANTFTGKNIRLMNDLDLGGTRPVPSTWIPIGTASSPFKGSFGGYNYTINHLYCNNSGNDNVGLFGYIENASIDNIQLRDVNVVGHSNVGGLIGYSKISTVNYCSVTGRVIGSGENIGGMIGCNYIYNSNINLTNCFAIVEVDANESAGGLIGQYSVNSTNCGLYSSFSAGSVYSQGVSGGLVGVLYLYNSFNITSCYSNATVTGTKCGGLIGTGGGLCNINESYVSGSVKDGFGLIWNGGSSTAAHCSNCFFDTQSTGCCDNGITGVSAKMTSEMTNSIGFGMTASSWNYAEGLYPQIRTIQEAHPEMSKLSVSPFFLQNNENSSEVHSNFQVSTANGVTWSSSDPDVIGINGSNANVNPMMIAKTVTLTASLNGISKQINVTVAGSDTIFVYQPNELRLVAEQCNAGVTYEGKYVKLMNDIEFELGVPNNMTQIGSYPDHPFMGTLDGNGKVIRNVYIDHPNNEYQGFFGYTKDANLYEVGLENLTISGRNYTGGLVSYAENSYIRDSYVNGGTLFALSYVGGLVGYQSPGTNSVICGCYNTCEVTGNNYLGGLVGYSNQATVRNSYVIAPVNGNGNAVGAIIGRADQVLMYNCYFSIEETGQTQAIGENNLKDGDEGMHSADMKTADFVNKLNRNLVVEVWRSDYANNINNGFPIIKWQPDYNNPCQPPVNLMVNEVGGLYAKLSWQGTADSYLVAYGKDGVYNQTITTTENNIRLEGLQLNTDYVWKIKAICGEHETDYVIGQPFKTQGTGVDENDAIIVVVYPNPTNGKVTFEAEDLKHIIISNLLGQTIFDGDASDNAFEYDFSKHKTGIYLIRIETANGVVVKKVSVVR